LVSVKTKSALEHLGLALFIIAGFLLGLSFIFFIEDVADKYLILTFSAGMGCMFLGIIVQVFASKLKPKFPKRQVEKIASYATPILESKGKVSLHDIAANTGMDVSEVKKYLEGTGSCFGMIHDGYFENARLEGGWLVKVAPVLCQYCGMEVPSGAKKCPHCGAAVKK